MTDAVIFDMYETLITLHAAPLYFSAEMAQDAGVAVEELRRLWYPTEAQRTRGQLSFEAALEPVLRQLGCFTPELLARMGRRRREAKRAAFEHLHPQILPMLCRLKERGVRIGLITNCFLEEAEYIRGSELYPYFHTAMLSCAEGLSKPDPAIFLRCLQGLGVEASRCLYVGDGGSCELESAQALGMRAAQAVWYLKEGTLQPKGRMPAFTQLETPMDVLEML